MKSTKGKKSYSPLILLGLILLLTGCGKNSSTIVFDASIAEDATPHILEAIKQLPNNATTLKFEKGVYNFYPDKGLESYNYISNHTDGMSTAAFPLDNIKDLTVDGQGSTFIFHGVMIPFLIEDCENITIQNLSIDWDKPFHSEAKVIAINEKNHTFDISISDEYPYELRNKEIWFIKNHYEHNLGQNMLYDPVRSAVAYNAESYTIYTHKRPKVRRNLDKVNYKYEVDPKALEFKNLGFEYSLDIQELSPGILRITGQKKALPPVGTVISMKGTQGLNRTSPAFRVNHTKTFNGTNINIHHAGGMGIIVENSSDILLDSFNITPSKGHMVSTTADATHFVGCRGKIEIINCIFNNQLDDAINVHGTYQKVVDILENNRIGVRMGHDQQKGFTIGYSGDTLGLVRIAESFEPYHHVTIKDIEYINGRYQIITLNERLPKNIETGDLVENISAYPELYVRNCDISRNRARGMLISTPKKTVIEDNYFHTEMEALLIPVENSHWYESGNGSNITIKNNVFQDCNHSGLDRGVIRFCTDDDNDNIAFKNIIIKDNTFNHFDSQILEISNVDGLVFENNHITNSNTFPPLFPESTPIVIKSSRDIIFNKNKYEGRSEKIIEVENMTSTPSFN